MKEVWFDVLIGCLFTYIAVWVLSLVIRFAIPRHDIVASLIGIGYAGCFVVGIVIMVGRVIQLLRK